MPDKLAKLSEREVSAITAGIKRSFPNGLKCPACQHSDFDLEPFVFTPVGDGLESLVLSGQLPTLPMIYLTCNVCTYVMQFGASRFGVDFPTEETVESPAKKIGGENGQ